MTTDDFREVEQVTDYIDERGYIYVGKTKEDVDRLRQTARERVEKEQEEAEIERLTNIYRQQLGKSWIRRSLDKILPFKIVIVPKKEF